VARRTGESFLKAKAVSSQKRKDIFWFFVFGPNAAQVPSPYLNRSREKRLSWFLPSSAAPVSVEIGPKPWRFHTARRTRAFPGIVQ
jgi:hypothetical protein